MLWLAFHTLGFSCLGGAIFLELLVFYDIVTHGFFYGYEHNALILAFEITLSGFVVVYFSVMYVTFIRLVRRAVFH